MFHVEHILVPILYSLVPDHIHNYAYISGKLRRMTHIFAKNTIHIYPYHQNYMSLYAHVPALKTLKKTLKKVCFERHFSIPAQAVSSQSGQFIFFRPSEPASSRP